MTESSFLQRRVGRCHVLTLVMIFLLVVAIVIGVILIVTLKPGDQQPASVTSDIPDGDCIDVAIIGAGIGGSYTAWRLRDRGLAISVFEYSDRGGGRLFRTEFPAAPGTYLEFGGMRFKSGAHPILNKTATELGLSVVPFELGYGNADETIYYTRGKRLRNTDLGTNSVPYDLPPGELKDPDTLIGDLMNNNLNFSSNTYPDLDEMYTLSTEDGIPMYKMTLDNFYGRYASREAYNYILDTSGWADSVGVVGALQGPKLYTYYPGDTGSSEGYKTIDGGMDLVPKRLVEQFTELSTSHKLQLNKQLARIEKRSGGGYSLWFRETTTTNGITSLVKAPEIKMCARKVILATQKRCIQDIDFPAFRDNENIVRNLESVVDYPAGRIYLAYNTSWWKTNSSDITHTKSDLPTRQTYDWQTGSNNVSIIMGSYHDGDLAHYWRELSQFGSPIPGSLPGVNAVTDEVKNRLEKYLSAIYDYKLEDIPEAVGGGMMLWDSYPFYAAWSYFKPGFDERKVRQLLRKPSPSDDVYIVSNSWSADDLQGWSEGSLIAADEVINMYF